MFMGSFMDILQLIPHPDSIPVHWLWFKVLLLLTFGLHLLLVNVVLGGSLLLSYDTFRGRPLPAESHGFPTLLALTINLGVPPLLFMQVLYGHFFYSSSILMAFYWLMVIPVLICAYYGSYIYTAAKERSILQKSAVFLSTSFLLAIAFVFVNNMTLMIQPARWTAYFKNAHGTILNLTDPVLYPRYLHFLVGSMAIASLFRVLYYSYEEKKSGVPYSQERRSNLRLFSFMTMAQVIIGFWFLYALPKEIMMVFLGGSIPYTVLFGCAVVLAIILISLSIRQKLKATIIAFLALFCSMVLLRDQVRTEYLKPYFSEKTLHVVPQVSPMIFFLLTLIVGIGVIIVMLRWIQTTEESS